MCMAAYIASDRALPLVPWNPDAPAMYIEPASDTITARLRRHVLTRRHIYFTGAHQRCACNFACESDEEGSVEEKAAWKSLSALATYLADVTTDGDVQFFACWMGDEGKPPTARSAVTVDYFCRR